MNTSGERLKKLLAELGLTASDFAAQRKVSPQHVNNWYHRGVPLARMDEFAALLCVRSKWLRTGEGPKHHNPLPRLSQQPGMPAPTPPDHSRLAAQSHDDRLLPFHRTVGAGLEAHRSRQLRLPRALFDSLDVDPRKAMAVSMPDYNMAPLMPYGCTLAVDCGMTHIVEDEVYVVLHHDRLRVNYIDKRPGGCLRLRSLDSDEFPAETYRPNQIKSQGLQIVGWVFWWSQLRAERPQPRQSARR